MSQNLLALVLYYRNAGLNDAVAAQLQILILEEAVLGMTKNADNDNSTRAVASAAGPSDGWSLLSEGNTALALQQEFQEPELKSDRSNETACSGPPELPDNSQPAEPTVGRQFAFSVSNARDLSDLGLEMLERPLPSRRVAAPRTDAFLQTASLPQASGISSASTGQLLAHGKFQRSRNEGEQEAYESVQTIEIAEITEVEAPQHVPVKQPRTPMPVSAQPGFLAGLIVAAITGAGLYLYLL